MRAALTGARANVGLSWCIVGWSVVRRTMYQALRANLGQGHVKYAGGYASAAHRRHKGRSRPSGAEIAHSKLFSIKIWVYR